MMGSATPKVTKAERHAQDRVKLELTAARPNWMVTIAAFFHAACPDRARSW
jgi:hypothetical protein